MNGNRTVSASAAPPQAVTWEGNFYRNQLLELQLELQVGIRENRIKWLKRGLFTSLIVNVLLGLITYIMI